jgi:hypothetical protein
MYIYKYTSPIKIHVILFDIRLSSLEPKNRIIIIIPIFDCVISISSTVSFLYLRLCHFYIFDCVIPIIDSVIPIIDSVIPIIDYVTSISLTVLFLLLTVSFLS